MDLVARIVAEIPHLRRYAGRLGNRRPDVDDLVQETIVRALSNAHQFNGGNVQAWLVVILRNLHFQTLRNQRTHKRLLPRTKPLSSEADLTPRVDLERLYERLPPILQQIVVLAAEGYGDEEAARMCGIPLGTAKTRLFRARRALKEGCDA